MTRVAVVALQAQRETDSRGDDSRRRELASRRRRKAARLVIFVILTLLAVSTLLPMWFLVSTSLKSTAEYARSPLAPPTHFDFGNFKTAWKEAEISRYFVNSLIVATATALLSVTVAALATYGLTHVKWRHRDRIVYVLLVGMALPPMILAVPIFVQMVDLRLINTYPSVILLYTAFNVPFSVYLLSSQYQTIPAAIVDAANVDGASVHRVFLSVFLPLTRPAQATLVIFNFVWSWNEFLFALLLLQSDSRKTLMVGLYGLEGRFTTDYPTLMAGLLISAMPLVAVYLTFQRFLVRGITFGATVD